MIALLMLYVAVLGGLCALAAACAERAALLARRPARGAWAVALVAATVLPNLMLWFPRPHVAGGTSLGALLDLLAAAGGVGSTGSPASVLTRPATRAVVSLGALDRSLAALWVACTVVALVRLALRARPARGPARSAAGASSSPRRSAPQR